MSPEAQEIFQTLRFISAACVEAWQCSERTQKQLSFLREARQCAQLQMRLLGIGAQPGRKHRDAESPIAAQAEPSVTPLSLPIEAGAPGPASEALTLGPEIPSPQPKTGPPSSPIILPPRLHRRKRRLRRTVQGFETLALPEKIAHLNSFQLPPESWVPLELLKPEEWDRALELLR